VSVPGGKSRNIAVVLGEGQRATVAATPDEAPAVPTQPAAAAAEPISKTRLLSWVLMGTGAASLITSGVFYGLRSSALSELDDSCKGDRCPQSSEGTYYKARSYTTVANITLGAGIGLAATGAVLWYVSRPSAKPAGGATADGLRLYAIGRTGAASHAELEVEAPEAVGQGAEAVEQDAILSARASVTPTLHATAVCTRRVEARALRAVQTETAWIYSNAHSLVNPARACSNALRAIHLRKPSGKHSSAAADAWNMQCHNACSSPGGAAGGGGGSSGGSSDPYDQARDACVTIINQYRAQVGAGPLARAKDMEACADNQAKVDAQHNSAHYAYFNGPQCILNNVTDRQNECPDFPGPPESGMQQCFAIVMKGGPGGGHYDVLTNRAYKRVACGIYAVSSDHLWMVQNYYAQ
jgi:hypothetical protein